LLRIGRWVGAETFTLNCLYGVAETLFGVIYENIVLLVNGSGSFGIDLDIEGDGVGAESGRVGHVGIDDLVGGGELAFVGGGAECGVVRPDKDGEIGGNVGAEFGAENVAVGGFGVSNFYR
jgi:hypothetical protein